MYKRTLQASAEEGQWSFCEIKSPTSYDSERSVTTPIFTDEVNGHWQMDLIDFQKYNERGYKWILTIVDVFSKYLWVWPLTNKTAEEVKEALSHIFQERRPITLQSYNGSEFKNKVISEYLHLWVSLRFS